MQAQALTRERQKLEAEAAKNKSQQSTMSKAVKNLVRQTRTVVEQIHETEMGKLTHRKKYRCTQVCFYKAKMGKVV